jgi:dTDP-4-dehydrorhamnose reductase
VTTPAPEIWAGPECTSLQLRDWACDQLRLTGHDARLQDIDRLAALGIKAVRYPVLWGRARHSRARTDWSWAARRLERLDALGIRVIVGLLHHGFGPTGLDPLDPGWPVAFGRYAGDVARRLPSARAFLPVNEPLTTARFAGAYGWWPPYGQDHGTFARLLLAQIQAHVAAVRAIRRVRPDVQVLANEDLGRTLGGTGCAEVAERDTSRRWLTFDLLMGRVDRSHPWRRSLEIGVRECRILDALTAEPEPPDVLGIDYYVTSDRYLDRRMELFPHHARGGDGTLRYADVELVRVGGHELGGFALCLEDAWDRYRIPVALTEVHLAGDPADQVAWWAEAVDAATSATARGIPVAGVTAWSTFGAFDWSSVLREPNGSYAVGCFDARTDPPVLTPLGAAVRETARGRPVTGSAGWWRRPDRVVYALDGAAPTAA